MTEPSTDATAFRGVMPALVTPMRSDGEINWDALLDQTEWVLTHGVHGVVPCGTTGESATLSADEQRAVIERVVQIVGGRVPVVAGAGGNDTRRVAELAAAAAEAGADGILSVTPYYNRPSIEGLVEHYRAVAEAADRPVILYNVPSRTGRDMTPDEVFRIAEAVPGVVGIKEASGKIDRFSTLLAERPSDFLVFSGDDELAFPAMAMGAEGVISVVANEAPGPMSDMADGLREGRLDDARAIHLRLLGVMRANFVTTNPVPVKTALQLMGRAPAFFRLPLTPLKVGDPALVTLRTALEEAGLIETVTLASR